MAWTNPVKKQTAEWRAQDQLKQFRAIIHRQKVQIEQLRQEQKPRSS